MKYSREVEFKHDSRLVNRKFTKSWANSGLINMDSIPDLVNSLVTQRHSMVEYIECLHDKIDKLMLDNNIYD